jgi:hypothetical protein
LLTSSFPKSKIISLANRRREESLPDSIFDFSFSLASYGNYSLCFCLIAPNACSGQVSRVRAVGSKSRE